MRYGFIYETTNLITGKKYIGQHKRQQNLADPDDTWYLGSGKYLIRALNKYGYENFSRRILCDCDNQEELDEEEKYYIKLYDAVNSPDYYNLCYDANPPHIIRVGSENPMYGKHLTEEHKKKISESCKGIKKSEEAKLKMSLNHADMSGKNSPMYGKHMSEETKRKLSYALSHPSDEIREKKSDLTKGENNPMYGKSHTEETRQKMSEAQSGEKNHFYGKKHSEETKKKISEANKGRKKVYHLTCKLCGKEFIGAGSTVKYCEDCR